MDGQNAHLVHGVEEALARTPKGFSNYAREAAATGVWDAAPVRPADGRS
ncbi:hypothetical protein [Streptomyces sp. S.PNR 29]